MDPWQNDLTEKLGPMMVKELRQGMRRHSFVLPFIIVQLLAVAALGIELFEGGMAEPTTHVGVMNVGLLVISGPFWGVVGVVVGLLMPLAGLLLMNQELDEGNHELMLLTHLSRWKVVLGKFIMLWGLCVLTVVSLLPYMVARFSLIGGIEWGREAACALTAIGLAAMMVAGAIGASSFLKLGPRILVFILFLGSMVAGCGIPIAASAGISRGCGVWYHVNALSAVVCYVALGLALARSRMRLVLHSFEVQPSWMMVGVVALAPIAIGLTTAFSVGYAGFVGLLGMAFLAKYADVTPKAAKRYAAPAPNIPPPLPQ